MFKIDLLPTECNNILQRNKHTIVKQLYSNKDVKQKNHILQR